MQERKSPYVQERKSPYVQERKSPYVKNYGIEEEETFSVPPKKQEENFFISSIGCNDIYSCW